MTFTHLHIMAEIRAAHNSGGIILCDGVGHVAGMDGG